MRLGMKQSCDNATVLKNLRSALLAAAARFINDSESLQRVDAQDIVQDVLLVLLMRLPEQLYDPDWPLILVITRRVVSRNVRRIRVESRRQSEYVERVRSISHSHDGGLRRCILRHDMLQARKKLRGAYRRVLTACLKGDVPAELLLHPSRAATRRYFGVDVLKLKKLLDLDSDVEV